ncbi:interferon-induced transmembrane protein 5 [Lates japonicus]|uniref:Interferon-induced transmembrane protein 5 n=1 Tax=Lates japonicus TaxID=270547 RepID=A0AAD3NMI3_LATJO|nr:interferon-induced transmembrane protein 5 [Lates japonicus]
MKFWKPSSPRKSKEPWDQPRWTSRRTRRTMARSGIRRFQPAARMLYHLALSSTPGPGCRPGPENLRVTCSWLQECSDKAKWYNILAAGWNLLIPLLAIVLLVLLLVHLGSSQGSFDFLGEDGFQNFMKLFSW